MQNKYIVKHAATFKCNKNESFSKAFSLAVIVFSFFQWNFYLPMLLTRFSDTLSSIQNSVHSILDEPVFSITKLTTPIHIVINSYQEANVNQNLADSLTVLIDFVLTFMLPCLPMILRKQFSKETILPNQ